ncbi:MAG TPA: glycoside hydrolase family 2 TIM barrel-domain containing protein [Mucilaginibacter sp.]|jgi:beta-galactosidase
MKKGLLVLFLLFSCCIYAQNKNDLPRLVSFDSNWRFQKGDIDNAVQPGYNDTKWRKLDLPHDWSIEDLPNQIPDSISGPFSKATISSRDGGFTVGGTAWYRKHFMLPANATGKQVYIQFDGVYMNADVWINGHHLGSHPYGYTSFYYELSGYLLAGKDNLIAICARNEGRNSRWYSGSGIYRHVWLTTVNPTHIDTWGTYITTPSVSVKGANVSIQTTIRKAPGGMPLTLLAEVYSPSGTLVGKSQQEISASGDSIRQVKQTVSVKFPQLWSLEKPQLYKAKVKIIETGKIIDETTTAFGIRTIHFDATSGFTLNGKNIKLHGGCIHHDNGPLGSAAIDRAEERKIELLKHQGYNAIRLSHNPPSPQLLDACDRLGMLVIDEAFDMWEQMKNPQDYHLYFDQWSEKDLTSMILRDRNHPSIIMWSIGNEIPEVVDSSGYAIGKRLSETVHGLDATRPVTMAIPLFATLGKKGKTWDDTAPSFANLDVDGYNYASSKYEGDHEKYPNRVMFASEYFPNRGIDNWLKVESLPYVIGTFSWTAMDYLGEAGLGAPRLQKNVKDAKSTNMFSAGSSPFLIPSWPIFNAYTGELDLIGDKKVNSYYLDVVWKRSAVEMLVHTPIPDGYKEENFYYNFPDQLKSWTFPGKEGKTMQVFVYSRAQKVTLELNGKKIGEQVIDPTKITARFDVPYQQGILIAKSYSDGKETGADTLHTTGKPFALRLRADRKTIKASRNDLSYVKVEVVDNKGNVVPYVDDLLIKYKIEGNGEIAGVGNGNPADASSFQLPEKKVFHGKGLVIVRPKGNSGIITLKAEAEGLIGTQVTIITR